MLTTTAILIGLLLFASLCRQMAMKVKDGGDMVLLIIGLGLKGLVVWQFYFKMLPLAWGAAE